MLAGLVALALGVTAAAAGGAGAAMRPDNAVNITVYHVAEANYSTIANNNLGDANGDAEFMLRAAGLKYLCSNKSGQADFTYDCQDVEQTASNLVVTKLVLEVNQDFSEYAECNIDSGTGEYACQCRGNTTGHHHGHHFPSVPCANTVGKVAVVNESGWAHEAPGSEPSPAPPPYEKSSYRYYFYNVAQKLQGNWFSTLQQGWCGHAGPNCTWRVVEQVKRINKTCQENFVFNVIEDKGKGCFDACPRPLDQSGACWTNCLYDTMLGPKSNSTVYGPGSSAGMAATTLVDAWVAPFADNGCPNV